LYINTSNGQLFYKLAQPTPPAVRPIPAATGTDIIVPPGTDTIQTAVAAANSGDRLVLQAGTYTLTSTVTVGANQSLTFLGQGIGVTTVFTNTVAVVNMFNVAASNVVFQNMSLVQVLPTTSLETVINFNNSSATGLYVDSCEISISEFGISFSTTEFQVTNCTFVYSPPPATTDNTYGCILITSNSGQSIIDGNTYVSGSGNSRCVLVRITNLTGSLEGTLVISNNTQDPASPNTQRHLLLMEQFNGFDFQLYIINNISSLEGNAPVLLFDPNLNIFRFIAVYGNRVQNSAGKGLIGLDADPSPSPPLPSAGTTEIFSSNNTIALLSFTTNWASATDPDTFIAGYDTTHIVQDPNLPFGSSYWLRLI